MPNKNPINAIGIGRLSVHGTVAPAGTGTPTLQSSGSGVQGSGYQVSRQGVGLYRATFDESYDNFESKLVSVQAADGTPTLIQMADWDSTNKTLDLRVFQCTAPTRTIDLPLALARELSTNDIPNVLANGGLLASDTTPALAAANAGTDQALAVTWAASNSDKLTWQVVLPSDLDGTAAVSVNFIAAMGGATDTPGMVVEAFFGLGDSDAGGTSSAFSTSASTQSVALAAGDVPDAGPVALSVTAAPGTHTTDTLVLYGAYLTLVSTSVSDWAPTDLAADDNATLSFNGLFRNSSIAF